MSEDPRAVWLSNVITSGMNEKGWVQRDLAGHLGVSQAAVSKWIRGKGGIEVEQAIRLALVLDHNVLEFVGRLWPEIAESDPVPSELRVLIDRATDAQVVEIVARARSIIESGRRRRAQPRPTITDTDHLAHAADRDDTKTGRSGTPHLGQPWDRVMGHSKFGTARTARKMGGSPATARDPVSALGGNRTPNLLIRSHR